MPVTKESNMHEYARIPENDESQVTNISQEDVRDVHAATVHLQQAGADAITAEDVSMEQSAAGNLKANRVSARFSAIANAEVTELLAEQAALGHVQAEKASVSGYIGAVGARTADIQNALTGVVFGETVNIGESSRTVLLIGQNINGNVTTLMDKRAALIAGLVGGLFAGIMLLLGRMLFGRR